MNRLAIISRSHVT